MGEAKLVGEQVFSALETLHPDPRQARLGQSGDAPGLVHNRVRPWSILWNAAEERTTLVGFSHLTRPGPTGALPIPQGDPYEPPDSGELGHDPSVDLYAACVVLLEAVTLQRSPGSVESEPLHGFMDKALARAQRHRFADARAAREAWVEVAGKTRIAAIPPEWHHLEEQISETALRLGVEPQADPLITARSLIPFGEVDTVRDLETLNQIKYDIKGELARFQSFAAGIGQDLRGLDGKQRPR